ncbi:AraC family transcriptional regulator N-terminal domain-containing protein, partial [Chenggangzhangella methanolivorans]|uniref:AraC family transcriptional regulator n=1 Tax=Chenggangzhangella methanolivorans TaxID=1437009 RepID=UPI00360B9DDF
MTALLDAVRAHIDLQGAGDGVFDTPVAGLTLVRVTAPSELVHQIPRPLAALVLQGSKHVAMGVTAFDFSAGDSLLVTADVPTLSKITRASPAAPYVSLVLELDPAVIADLTAQMPQEETGDRAPVRVHPTDAETADAALRLMRLFERPSSLPVLAPQLVREMHYWLLAGRHGAAIRLLGWPEGHVRRVAQAVERPNHVWSYDFVEDRTHDG